MVLQSVMQAVAKVLVGKSEGLVSAPTSLVNTLAAKDGTERQNGGEEGEGCISPNLSRHNIATVWW
jgi:hypothetical protein